MQNARHVVGIGGGLFAHVALATAVHFEMGTHLWTVLLEFGFFLAGSDRVDAYITGFADPQNVVVQRVFLGGEESSQLVNIANSLTTC